MFIGLPVRTLPVDTYPFLEGFDAATWLGSGREAPSISRRSCAANTGEMLSKGGGRSETDGPRDFIDGIACRFEQPLGIQQALMGKPLVRRRSGLFPKPSGKRPGGH